VARFWPFSALAASPKAPTVGAVRCNRMTITPHRALPARKMPQNRAPPSENINNSELLFISRADFNFLERDVIDEAMHCRNVTTLPTVWNVKER